MFTGIVEEAGQVLAMERTEGLLRMRMSARKTCEGMQIGDSICVSGVCLTAVEIGKEVLTVELVPETLRRSSLGMLEVGSFVNLERAMTLGRFFGGHYVQGHVDCAVTLTELCADGDATLLTFRLDTAGADSNVPPAARYLVPKGYATLDGTSLTLVEVAGNEFSISLIPHTYNTVTLGGQAPGTLKVGVRVNLEVDVIAKYVERFTVGER